MKVYMVEDYWTNNESYEIFAESNSILGIFSTQEKAIEFVQSLIAEREWEDVGEAVYEEINYRKYDYLDEDDFYMYLSITEYEVDKGGKE